MPIVLNSKLGIRRVDEERRRSVLIDNWTYCGRQSNKSIWRTKKCCPDFWENEKKKGGLICRESENFYALTTPFKMFSISGRELSSWFHWLPLVDALRNQFTSPPQSLIDTVLIAQSQLGDGFLDRNNLSQWKFFFERNVLQPNSTHSLSLSK